MTPLTVVQFFSLLFFAFHQCDAHGLLNTILLPPPPPKRLPPRGEVIETKPGLKPVIIPPAEGPPAAPSPFTHCGVCMPRDCGKPRTPWDMYGRISGGMNSTAGRYPWHALIRADGEPIGSGALITCNLVLTTAYILERHNVSSLDVVLGVARINRALPFNIFKVKSTHPYPLWNASVSLFAWDFAIIQLAREVDFETTNGYIATVCLPRARQAFDGMLTITGYGANLQGGENAILQEVKYEKVGVETCAAFRDTSYTFCARGSSEGALCFGDRGSPVVQSSKNQRLVLVGITNDYQCQAEQPDVFTTVAYFIDWICNLSLS